MTLLLPDVSTTLEKLMLIEASFRKTTQTIGEWVNEHRDAIKTNLKLTQERSDENDMKVLRILLRELLMTVSGNAGERLRHALDEIVKTKDDLTPENYERVLKQARYRWGSRGSQVMKDVVSYFKDTLHWNWEAYLEQAASDGAKQSNFSHDKLRKITHVGPKVRDLALSNFNENYAAFDLHVIRVVARIGLVGYGWELTKDAGIEFGTDPSDKSNYLFFRRLFIELARLAGGRFTPVDLDRIFWHHGRGLCQVTTQCGKCPINDVCLTGKQRNTNALVHSE